MIRLYTIYPDIQPCGKPRQLEKLFSQIQRERDVELIDTLSEAGIKFPLTKDDFNRHRAYLLDLSSTLPSTHNMLLVDTDDSTCTAFNQGIPRSYEDYSAACTAICGIEANMYILRKP